MGSRKPCIVLTGPSGTGKSSILHYMEETLGAQSAPKYTTRRSRRTADDERDFIFCELAGFPKEGVLRFESYGDIFGIQLEPIAKSIQEGALHALIVGDHAAVRQLATLYGDQVVTVFVFCATSILRQRLLTDPLSQRAGRWEFVEQELVHIYDQLAGVQHVVDNSGSLERSLEQVRDIVASFSGNPDGR